MHRLEPSPTALAGRDPGPFLWGLSARTWIECPVCAGPALVATNGCGGRLSCTGCGHVRKTASPQLAGNAASQRGDGCTRCGGRLPRLDRIIARRHGDRLIRSIRCTGCGRRSDYALRPALPDMRNGIDPWFGQPLFLRTMVGSHELWALNPEHFDYLDGYLGASLRKRALGPHRMTMMARLHRWMKAAHPRAAVAHDLAVLRQRAERLP